MLPLSKLCRLVPDAEGEFVCEVCGTRTLIQKLKVQCKGAGSEARDLRSLGTSEQLRKKAAEQTKARTSNDSGESPEYQQGVGTELRKIFQEWAERLHIQAPPPCAQCRETERRMNKEGPDWCEENIKGLARGVSQRARAKGVPLVSLAAAVLIRKAIQRVRAQSEV